MNITLYNFDAKTGKVLQNGDLIHDINGFIEVVKKYFKTEVEAKGDEDLADYFFGEEFHLPANIGFNDEGVFNFI